jgi:urate oxidase
MRTSKAQDIISYTVFANIDKGEKIQGHKLYLSIEQIQAITQIIQSKRKIVVNQNCLYEMGTRNAV